MTFENTVVKMILNMSQEKKQFLFKVFLLVVIGYIASFLVLSGRPKYTCTNKDIYKGSCVASCKSKDDNLCLLSCGCSATELKKSQGNVFKQSFVGSFVALGLWVFTYTIKNN
jgi:hypothetical protein